jgi:hypothetical protein
MDDARIVRFRRRWRDGSTSPLLSAGQAEAISEELLADERRARAKWRQRRVEPPQYGAKCLHRLAPARRRAIVAAACRNVNSRWVTGLVIGVPLALYGVAMWLGDGVMPEYFGIYMLMLLFLPAIVIHIGLVRREIERLVAGESVAEQRSL